MRTILNFSQYVWILRLLDLWQCNHQHSYSNYRISPNSFLPWIVSPLQYFPRQLFNLWSKFIAIMRKLYENFHIFHFQKRIVSVETMLVNTYSDSFTSLLLLLLFYLFEVFCLLPTAYSLLAYLMKAKWASFLKKVS